MKNKKIINKRIDLTIKTLLAVYIIILLIFSPLYFFAFNKNYFEKQLDKNPDTTLSKEEKSSLNNNVIDYLQGKTELSSKFNSRETKHMEDVKKIFDITKIIFIVSLAILISSFIIYYKKDKKEMLKPIFFGSTIASIIMLLIAIGATFLFVYSFEIFHKIFFVGDTWLFYIDDLLIILFPETFFANISKNIFLSGFVLSTTISILTFSALKKKKKKKKKLPSNN